MAIVVIRSNRLKYRGSWNIQSIFYRTLTAFGTNEFGSIGIDTVVLDRFHLILVVLDEINKESKYYSISVYCYLHACVCTNSGKVICLGVHISAVVDPGFLKRWGHKGMDACGHG